MEKELNIAAILKEKPKETKLYSPIYGEVLLKRLTEGDGIRVLCISPRGILGTDEKPFWKNGKYTLGGEVCLFPSKQMRDWSKFAWKKGDVLKVEIGSSGCSCVFDRFTNDDYTEFTGVFDKYLDRFDSFATSDWCKVTDEKEYESIIQRIETQYGGKLNLDTLKIEKPQFKDGDIVHYTNKNWTYVFISRGNGAKSVYASLRCQEGVVDYNIDNICSNPTNLRPATEDEKQQLFAALEKENKAWDAEKKAIVDLPKKCEFKAFDKVLVRCKDYQKWKVDFFSHYDDSCKGFPYVCVSSRKSFCIPYNDQTAHLLGTTDDWEGGEG